jgi:hypothetical protein
VGLFPLLPASLPRKNVWIFRDDAGVHTIAKILGN